MPTVLITGCDTGLGRGFAVHYARAGYTVLATYRELANRLPDDDHIEHYALDVSRAEAFATLKEELGSRPIDILLSNAGIGREKARFGAVDFEYLAAMWAVNTVGPLRLVETFIDNVSTSDQRKVVLISSRMGSIAANLSGGHYGYRASKAGLNAIGRSLAIDLFERSILVATFHPGWVNTVGDERAPLSVEESVASMVDVIRRLGSHETGQFYDYAGRQLPW